MSEIPTYSDGQVRNYETMDRECPEEYRPSRLVSILAHGFVGVALGVIAAVMIVVIAYALRGSHAP